MYRIAGSGAEWLPVDAWFREQRESLRHSPLLADQLESAEMLTTRHPEAFVLGAGRFESALRHHQRRQLEARLRAMSKHEQRRVQITAALRKAPDVTDREIARRVNCHHSTVAKVRDDLTRTGYLATFIRRRDPRSGRLSQAGSKPRRSPTTPSIKVAI